MSVKKAVLYVKGKSLQLKVNGVSGKTVWSSANKKSLKSALRENNSSKN